MDWDRFIKRARKARRYRKWSNFFVISYGLITVIMIGATYLLHEQYVDLEESYEKILAYKKLDCLKSNIVINVTAGECKMSLNTSGIDPVLMDELTYLRETNIRFARAKVYDNVSYNCKNYSRDYYFVLTQLGYNVSMVGGYNPLDDKAGHVWNRVVLDIEPQTGEFKDFRTEFPIGLHWSSIELIKRGR